MNQEYHLTKAIQQCLAWKGKRLLYTGNDAYCKDHIGEIVILYDQNCCSPTQDVLFAFECGERQRIMSGEECLLFLKDCLVIEE